MDPGFMTHYLRRGYFPDDAKSAYERWRAAAHIDPSALNEEALNNFIEAIWFAGWRTRGQVAYGEPDITKASTTDESSGRIHEVLAGPIPASDSSD